MAKKGGETVVEVPRYMPPPAAPAVQAAATQEEAVTPEEEARRKKLAESKGATSLQIPATTGGATTNTVGGVATKKP